jgi:hypothetical protein
MTPGTVLTHPAGWGPQRRSLLVDAAQRAGLPAVGLVAEPVAAAMYFTDGLGHHVPDGHSVVVYDFGGGTFDISVVRRLNGGWHVLLADPTAPPPAVHAAPATVSPAAAPVPAPAPPPPAPSPVSPPPRTPSPVRTPGRRTTRSPPP